MPTGKLRKFGRQLVAVSTSAWEVGQHLEALVEVVDQLVCGCRIVSSDEVPNLREITKRVGRLRYQAHARSPLLLSPPLLKQATAFGFDLCRIPRRKLATVGLIDAHLDLAAK